MGFPNLLLNIGLILATITVFCVADDSKVTYRLPNNTRAPNYNIRLIPHLEEDYFYGEIDVVVEILYASSNISLHSEELEINKTETTLTEYDTRNIYKPMEHIHNNVTNILTLTFNRTLRGFYYLYMEFVGHFSESGFLKSGFMKIPYTDEKGDSTMAVTLLEPNKARRMFPCWDEPALKALFNIAVKHHKNYTVLSNMPIGEQIVERDDMIWTRFNTTPIMSTYLVGIVISNLVRVSNANETINVWCRPSLISQAKFVLSFAEYFTSILVQYTNSSVKVPKMDHVMVQNYPVSSMENWGLIIYKESNVIFNASTDPIFKRRRIAWLVSRKLVHQWIGNLVTPAWWSNLWLSEGFAVFFEAYLSDKIFDWRAMDFLVIYRLHRSLSLDIGSFGPVKLELDHTFDYGDLFIREVYFKAPVILRMLHHTISDEVFQKGVTTYLATYQFRSVTPDDLWSAMQSALDESYIIPHEDFKIKEVMDTWINQNRYPVLNVTRNYETSEVAITQKCVRATEDVNYEWWIPVTFATQSNPDFAKTVPNHWIGPNQTSSFEVYSNEWIIVNVQQTAYCRVYYDVRNWQKIIHYLNSDEYTNIHVLNRAQIIDDACFFLMESQLDSSLFFNLTSYLSRERDYVAWFPLFRFFKRFSQFFSLPEREGFKTNVVRIFDGLLQHVGYEENLNEDDITKTLRLEATKWACTFGHVECKRMATVKLSEHLADPDTHKFPHWWQDWTYCFGLALANRTTWDKMLELYQRKPERKFLEVLSCAENPDIIKHCLNIASNTTLFRNEEHFFIFKNILVKHARNDLILDYILENFETIKPRSIATNLIIKEILWNLISNEQLYKVKEFAETHFHHNPEILSTIEGLIERLKNSLQLARNGYTKRFERN